MKHQTIAFSPKANYTVRQRGASLLEGIAYLGIAAIVILGAVSLLGSAFSSATTNRELEQVVSIRTGVKKLFQGQGSYGTGNLNANLILAKAIPTTLAINNNTITNSWGGTITVTGTTSTFTIAYSNVPQDVCINMLTNSNGWQQVQVGGATTTTFPISPTTAAASCSAATNNVTWTAA